MAEEHLPDEVSEDIEKLEERKEHFEAWQESLRQAQEAAPIVQENLEQTDWQIRALKNSPPEAVEIPYQSRRDELERENQSLRETFPVLTPREWRYVMSSTAATTSGSSDVYDYVNRVRDLGTPDAIHYGNAYITEYDQLQEAQGRAREVRSLLEDFSSPSLLERFERALNAYVAYKSDTGEKTSAGNEMRNLLNGVGGELLERARHWPKENITWRKMCPRLAIGGGGGYQHISLERQGRVRSQLLSRLADVLKDREGGSITNVHTIWTELLDHLYTVFRLIDIGEE